MTASRQAGPSRRQLAWEWTVPLAAALVILALPLLSTNSTRVYDGLSYGRIALVTLAGGAGGWLLVHLLATGRRSPRTTGAVTTVVLVAGWLLGNAVVAGAFVPAHPTAVNVLALGAIGGALVRGPSARPRSLDDVVALAALASWITWDIPNGLFRPLRDLHSYLAAAAIASSGGSPYLSAPMGLPPGPDNSPFVYPPVTLPFFEFLAGLPRQTVEVGWVVGLLLAALAGLWLLGVRGRWLALLMAWPPLVSGIAVSNVSVLGFLFLAAGVRQPGALVFGGFFKLQSGIPALWGLAERRYRSVLAGLAALGLAVVVSLAVTGLRPWGAWLGALGAFQQTVERFPEMKGLALDHWLPTLAAGAVGVVAVFVALLGRGRNRLARLGLASVIASPTLYVHGLALLLPGALALPPALFWLVSATLPWVATASLGTWAAVAIIAAALLTTSGDDLTIEARPGPDRAAVHPLEQTGQVWPRRAERRGPGEAG